MEVTPYSHYTDDELIAIVYQKEDATPLELELVHRLEQAELALERRDLDLVEEADDA
jgi:hypothetical protein